MQAQLDRLSDWFDPLSGSMTAFSGGVDSALVLYLSKRFLFLLCYFSHWPSKQSSYAVLRL
jgi:PP-loop superfamily ATP-utilizing enzyme